MVTFLAVWALAPVGCLPQRSLLDIGNLADLGDETSSTFVAHGVVARRTVASAKTAGLRFEWRMALS